MEGEKSQDFRKTPRAPQEKHFAINENEMTGTSNVERFKKYPEFQDAETLARTCNLYATSYSQTMIMRIEKEDPNFFDDKDYTRAEIIAKVSHNMCLQISQFRSKVFQNTVTDMLDKDHTKEEIRRLVNGGQRFHPYF